MADPYRLHILDLLTQGEACHSELKEQVGLPPNLLSHHLRVLRQAELVRTRHDTIDGRWIYYAANLVNHSRLDETDRKLKRFVLFLCTGNSCRSQMAEAIVNTRLGDEWVAFSAGTQPAGCVHPRAVESLAEVGINWRGRSAKHTMNSSQSYLV